MRRLVAIVAIAAVLAGCGGGDGSGTPPKTEGPARLEAAVAAEIPGRPVGIAAGEGSLWVTSWKRNGVSRIDPATGEVTATIRTGKGALNVALGEGSVWVSNHLGDHPPVRIGHDRMDCTLDLSGYPPRSLSIRRPHHDEYIKIPQAVVQLCRYRIPGLDLPLIEPHSRPSKLKICSQTPSLFGVQLVVRQEDPHVFSLVIWAFHWAFSPAI